jgi:cytidyltransferase-like protein
MSRIAVVPGSFDPVTLGHLDVIGRAAALFDELHVLVVHNPGKTPLLPIAQRVSLLEESIREAGLPDNIIVTSWSVGLLVDYCTDVGASVIVKGIRSQVPPSRPFSCCRTPPTRTCRARSCARWPRSAVTSRRTCRGSSPTSSPRSVRTARARWRGHPRKDRHASPQTGPQSVRRTVRTP